MALREAVAVVVERMRKEGLDRWADQLDLILKASDEESSVGSRYQDLQRLQDKQREKFILENDECEFPASALVIDGPEAEGGALTVAIDPLMPVGARAVLSGRHVYELSEKRELFFVKTLGENNES